MPAADPVFVPFSRICIIGAGLIGSSILRAARHYHCATNLVACDLPAVLARVADLGIADQHVVDPAQAVADADLVLLCAPVGMLGALAQRIGPFLKPGAILSDVGSTKMSVLRDVGPHVPDGVHFVPGHPMAGTEYSGPDAGFATLFEGRWCLLTPPPGTDAGAVAVLTAFWQRCGALVEQMDPAHHDRVAAIVSHLPHLIAFTICGTADDLADESRGQVLQFAASGFRDFTRIASSDPVMWRDIFLNNREALLEMLARFTEDAQAMARAVRWGDTAYIEDRIARGRKIRHNLIALNQA